MADLNDDHLIEIRLQTEQLFKGHFLDVRRATVRLPSGDTATREYIEHPGAVMVIPLLDDGRVILERQYRTPIGRVLWEFPAGKIDPGESTFTCAMRELAEETGYRAAEWARAGIMHNACAYSTEGIEVWFARGLTHGNQALDHGEHLEIVPLDERELDALAARGELTDAKTLVGVLWLHRWRAGAWPLQWQASIPN
ncbi:MAG TPA: NUDIX hydrolase [Burkholderiaceae bacterium]|nr:NUDIX hydrolase [Burkholderiaceae bacterium]